MTILEPGFVRWDGQKFVTDPDAEVIGVTGSPGPPGIAGPTGPQGAGANIIIKHGGTTVVNSAGIINFSGLGVGITGSSNTANINISGSDRFTMVNQPIATTATSGNPLIIGTIYFDPHSILSSGITSMIFQVHFETLNGSEPAHIDFFDWDGVTNNGASITISGSLLSTTSTTGMAVKSNNLASILNLSSGPGIFKVRLWSDDGVSSAICNYAALMIG